MPDKAMVQVQDECCQYHRVSTISKVWLISCSWKCTRPETMQNYSLKSI